MSHNVKDLVFTENDTKTFQTAMDAEIQKAIKHFESELLKIRTGRAHTSMIEDLPVACYGQNPTPLRGLAVLAAPEARLLTIQPWDLSIITDIERALTQSDLGIRPVSDGKIIRISLPEMSTTRRDELAKQLGKEEEKAKITIRNIRKDFNNALRDAKKDKKISENFFNRLEDLLQKITDSHITKVEELARKKEKEITTV